MKRTDAIITGYLSIFRIPRVVHRFFWNIRKYCYWFAILSEIWCYFLYTSFYNSFNLEHLFAIILLCSKTKTDTGTMKVNVPLELHADIMPYSGQFRRYNFPPYKKVAVLIGSNNEKTPQSGKTLISSKRRTINEVFKYLATSTLWCIGVAFVFVFFLEALMDGFLINWTKEMTSIVFILGCEKSILRNFGKPILLVRFSYSSKSKEFTRKLNSSSRCRSSWYNCTSFQNMAFSEN